MGVVEDCEGVEGGVGAVAAYFAVFAFGVVEDHGGGGDSTPEGVDTAAAEIFASSGEVFLFAEGGLRPEAGGLVGFDGGSADLGDEALRKGEGLVADHPGRKAVAGSAGEEAVFRIAFEGEGIGFG